MKTNLPKEIRSVEHAKAFLTELFGNDEGFHPEDDATDLIWSIPAEQIPTMDECKQLNKLMDDIYDLGGFDPCEYILCYLIKSF